MSGLEITEAHPFPSHHPQVESPLIINGWAKPGVVSKMLISHWGFFKKKIVLNNKYKVIYGCEDLFRRGT